METNTWKIEKDLCRCCHTEGSFKNLAEPCIEMGEEEIYCDMLRDSFDIDLTPVPGNLCAPTYTICETCIHRLRDAALFKKQVLCCEKKFREMYSKNVIIAAPPPFLFDVKQEPDPSDDYMKYELMGLDSDDSDDDKASLHIKCKDSEDSDDEDDYKLSTLETKKKGKVAQKRQKTTKTKKEQKKVKTKKEKAADEEGQEGDDADGDEEKPKKKEKREFPWKTYYKREGGEYICLTCGVRGKKSSAIITHVKLKHVPTYKCPSCEESFYTKAPFVNHKLEKHNIDDRIQCTACDSRLTTPQGLYIHINSVHKMGRRIKCKSCDFVAHCQSRMKRHTFKHKPASLKCKYCGKMYKTLGTLNFHIRIHTGDKRKVCKECGERFVQKASLNYHMIKHHPEVHF